METKCQISWTKDCQLNGWEYDDLKDCFEKYEEPKKEKWVFCGNDKFSISWNELPLTFSGNIDIMTYISKNFSFIGANIVPVPETLVVPIYVYNLLISDLRSLKSFSNNIIYFYHTFGCTKIILE